MNSAKHAAGFERWADQRRAEIDYGRGKQRLEGKCKPRWLGNWRELTNHTPSAYRLIKATILQRSNRAKSLLGHLKKRMAGCQQAARRRPESVQGDEVA